MSIEIERRFLVKNEEWRPLVIRKMQIEQGYLVSHGDATVRVRIANHHTATLTIKSHAAGISRAEFEYPIPLDDAARLLELRVGSLIRKVRHIAISNGLVWEIDVFEGDNAGLVIAEVELKSIVQQVRLPNWAGSEISGDARFSNSHLSQQPYRIFVAWHHENELPLAGE